MKKFSVLALVLAFTMMLSVVSFAADPTYRFKTTGAAVGGTATVTTAENTDNFIVSTGAVDDSYYGVLLVKGDDLPVVDNAILYIDQLTADGTAAEFTVKPIMPEVGEALTLYISSNVAGAELIKIPMIYSADAPAYTLGDINSDKTINISDVLLVLNAYLGATTLDATQKLAADVAPAGKPDGVINISDVLLVLNVYLGAATL